MSPAPRWGVSLATLEGGTPHCVSLGVPSQPSRVCGRPCPWPGGAGVAPRMGMGPAAVTHFWTAYLFSSTLPHRVAAQGPGVGPCPAPGDHPAVPGSLGNPGGSPAPAWSFGRAAGGGGSESLRVTAAGAIFAGLEGPKGHESPVVPVTLGRVPAAQGDGGVTPGRALLWQQDVVWDVTSPAACHPSGIAVWICASPEMSPCCFMHQPVLIVVPAKEHLPSGASVALRCHQWLPFSGQC